ncbi:MAG: hypothetical protein KAR24_00430 [Candidatus Pacebacteria bacterium]|nr:hypothetical protein [Candidatus Paceibacterota bacterium]
MLIGSVVGSLTSIMPLQALAAASIWCDSAGDCSFKIFVGGVIDSILKPIVPIIVGLTVVMFLWGSTQYLTHGEDPEQRSEGKRKMLLGIIALAMMVSFWGFAKLLKTTFF